MKFLKEYEGLVLFKRHDQVTKGMRRALGWKQPGFSTLSPDDAAKLLAIDSVAAIPKDAWDKLCSLFTVYRFIDTFVANSNLGGACVGAPNVSLNEPRQRTLNEATVKNIRVACFVPSA